MEATARKSDFIDAMEENKKDVRKMVMDSYRDIEKGKGRDYKEFFDLCLNSMNWMKTRN